jgi:hypothetical protein
VVSTTIEMRCIKGPAFGDHHPYCRVRMASPLGRPEPSRYRSRMEGYKKRTIVRDKTGRIADVSMAKSQWLFGEM